MRSSVPQLDGATVIEFDRTYFRIHVRHLYSFIYYIKYLFHVRIINTINKKKKEKIVERIKKNISRTNGRWYQSSINCRKLLTIMLSKSIAPLTLTACKLYTLNLESFTTVRIFFTLTFLLFLLFNRLLNNLIIRVRRYNLISILFFFFFKHNYRYIFPRFVTLFPDRFHIIIYSRLL